MRKNVAIIGTGRVGTALAYGLTEAGYLIKYLTSKPAADAQILAMELNSEYIEPPYSEVKNADIIFLTVPDGQISSVVGGLAGLTDTDWKGKSVIHTSGALTTELLEPLRKLGAITSSMHPLQTFPPGSKSERFKNIYFAVEGENTFLVEKIARDLGGTPFRIQSRNKILYHTAATIASNYMFALVSTAVRTLELSGIDKDGIDPLKVLFPLIKGTLGSIEEYGIKEGLTGPVARGDIETIERHIAELKSHSDLLAVYKLLGLELLKLADLDKKSKDKIESILNC